MRLSSAALCAGRKVAALSGGRIPHGAKCRRKSEYIDIGLRIIGIKWRGFVHGVFAGKGAALQDRVLSKCSNSTSTSSSARWKSRWWLPTADGTAKVDVPLLVIGLSPMWVPKMKKYVATLSSRTDYTSGWRRYFLMLEKPTEFNAALTDMLGKFDLIAKGPQPKMAH
jgi:hypothetical protein